MRAVSWRSGWDSNPRGVAAKLISSQPRYDRFDTAPQSGCIIAQDFCFFNRPLCLSSAGPRTGSAPFPRGNRSAAMLRRKGEKKPGAQTLPGFAPSGFSALLLLMLRILANDHDPALALDNLAFFANRLDRRTNLHKSLPPFLGTRLPFPEAPSRSGSPDTETPFLPEAFNSCCAR